MAISVTTRSGKGSPLTPSEMDTNLTNLARSATTTQEGNVELATSAETSALSDLTRAVVPGYLPDGIEAWLANLGLTNSKIVLYDGTNKVMIQWGTYSATISGGVTINFSTAFNAIPVVVATQKIGSSAALPDSLAISAISSSSFTAYGAVSSSGMTWIAVGTVA